MVSMHASLGQKYKRRALLLNCCLLGGSALLCSLTFAPDELFASLGIKALMLKLVLGGTSAFIFMLSIVDLRVNWEHTGQKHSEAASRLSPLKLRYRACHGAPLGERESLEKCLTEDYSRVMETLPQIPDRWFITLKAEHLFKKELSKAIAKNPTAPLWLIKLKLRYQGLKENSEPLSNKD